MAGELLRLSALFTAAGALPLLGARAALGAPPPDAPVRIGYLPITDATPLLVVNTDPIDFVRNADELEDLSRRILSHDEGTVYYSPMPKPDARPAAGAAKKPGRKRQETTA